MLLLAEDLMVMFILCNWKSIRGWTLWIQQFWMAPVLKLILNSGSAQCEKEQF